MFQFWGKIFIDKIGGRNKNFVQLEQKMFCSLFSFIKKNKKKNKFLDEMIIERMKDGERIDNSEELNKFFELFALKNRLRRSEYLKLKNKYFRTVVVEAPTSVNNYGFSFISLNEKETMVYNKVIEKILKREDLRPVHVCGGHQDFGINFPGKHVWEVWPKKEQKEKININYLFDLASEIEALVIKEL